MEQMLRFSAAALLGCTVCLLLRRSNPELQIPLGLLVCGFVLYGALTLLRPLGELLEEAQALSGLGSVYFAPVAKCVVIGILAKGASDLCRDGGQSAMAGAVELGGTAAALFAAAPLLTTLLGLLRRLL